jgi:hypothetical protein
VEPDLGVEGLDERVGEPVLDRRDDRGPVFSDAARQPDERRDAAALRPCDPATQGFNGAWA